MSDVAQRVEGERSRWQRWWPLLPCVVGGSLVAAWGWGSHPHPFIDFGREAYTPWRLSEGEVLYRDVAYFNGPLSPYLNSLLFRLFGVGLDTLFWANALWTLVIGVLLYHLLERLGGRFAAAVATGFFALGIAFTQLGPVGNDNYLAPYSHEMTHGLLLALLAFCLADSWLRHPRPTTLFATGLALGALALTKVELTLAAVGGVAVLGAVTALAAGRVREFTRALPTLLAGFILPPLLATVALATTMPLSNAAAGVAGSFIGALDGDVVGHRFYRWTRGTLQPVGNLQVLGAWLLGLGSLVGSAVVIGAWWPRRGTLVTSVTAFGVALGLWILPLRWTDAPRPLPLLLALLLVAAMYRLRIENDSSDWRGRTCLRIGLLAFALLLLAKVVLKARLTQYGFVLVMPGLCIAIVAALSWLPAWQLRRGHSPALARGTVLGVLAAATASLLLITGFFFDSRSQGLGSDRDAFRTDLRADYIRPALVALDTELAEDEPLLVIPEGVMWNYLLRRPTASRHLSYMPPELLLFGESEMLAELRASPPRWVALAHRNTSVYGVPLFGEDYGLELAGWLRREYEPVSLYGDPPLRPGSYFGIELWRRREPAAAPALQ